MEEKKQGKIAKFYEEKPKAKMWTIIGAGVLVVGIFIAGGTNQQGNAATEQAAAEEAEIEARLAEAAEKRGTNDGTINSGTDTDLARMQANLNARYGKPPTGFIWDDDGTPLSLGIKGMESDEAIYSFIRSLSTLDMGTAQKLSRKSVVVSNFDKYFSSTEREDRGDYDAAFKKDLYRAAMVSLQVEGVRDTSTFADNRRVYSINAKMLDMSDKEFWRADEKEILNNLYKYDTKQGDSVQADQYLNEYLINYYMSDEAKLRDVNFTLTVERYPDINTGWLVSIDQELDDALRYAEGKSSYMYIMEQYRSYAEDRIEKELSN